MWFNLLWTAYRGKIWWRRLVSYSGKGSKCLNCQFNFEIFQLIDWWLLIIIKLWYSLLLVPCCERNLSIQIKCAISTGLNNASSRIKWSQYWCFWFDKTVVSNKCILASLHTLQTDVLVDKFKKCGISVSSFSIIILVKLLNADCRIHLSAYLRGVLVWYYCLGVGYSFWVRPFS